MIVSIPQDIRAYESKSFGNFTGRQITCTAISLPVIALVFWSLYQVTNSVDLSALAAIFAGLPIIMCGIFKKHGLYLEQIIKYKLEWRFKYPRNRPFVMANLYEDIENLNKECDEYLEYAKKCQQAAAAQPKASSDTYPMEKKKHRTRKHTL